MAVCRSRISFDRAVIRRRALLTAIAGLPLGLLACKRAATPVSLVAGDLMPSLQLPTGKSEAFTLRAGTGPFLLNFWAT